MRGREKDVPSALMQCPKHGSSSSLRHMSETEQTNTDHQHSTPLPGLQGWRFEGLVGPTLYYGVMEESSERVTFVWIFSIKYHLIEQDVSNERTEYYPTSASCEQAPQTK